MRRLAILGITAQFLALVRTLGEVFRIKYYTPGRYSLDTIEPFVGAALFTAILLGGAILAYSFGRHRTALMVAGVDIVVLFVYRVVFM